MKNDFKVPVLAEVDVTKIKYRKSVSLGIDFANEIDIWAKMEFRASKQVKHLKLYGTTNKHEILYDLNTLVYAIREPID
jgi:hypothetical protein